MSQDSTGQDPPFRATPDAEKYVLAADALRRRQLESALVHGSGRTWRERRRIWPAAVGGIIAVVVIVAVVAVVGAFHRQQDITGQREQERRRLHQPSPAVSGSPAARAALAIGDAPVT